MLQNLHRTSTHPPPVKFARRARKIARRGKKIPLCAIFLARRGNNTPQLIWVSHLFFVSLHEETERLSNLHL